MARQHPGVTQDMINLYDEYTHLTLDRRRFMENLSKLAGGTAAAAAIMPLLAAQQAAAAIIAENDGRITTANVTYPGAAGEMMGYLALPTALPAGPLGTLIVVHENRGLNAHIQDVARRAAVAGFAALAPDFLSHAGGTPTDEDKAREMISALDPATTQANLVASSTYLRGRPFGNGKVGIVGFCWGGGMANALAVADPQLNAASAFYGAQPDAAAVPSIKAALMLHYAELDERINAGIDGYKTALDAAGIRYELFMYPGVNHAFHNDTSEARYNAEAANLAWDRTMEFFGKELASA